MKGLYTLTSAKKGLIVLGLQFLLISGCANHPIFSDPGKFGFDFGLDTPVGTIGSYLHLHREKDAEPAETDHDETH